MARPFPSTNHHRSSGSGGASMTARALPGLGQELRRLFGGLSLAAVYGLALGARSGGLALLRHALGAPATLLAIAVIAATISGPTSPRR